MSPESSAGLRASTESANTPSSDGSAETKAMAMKHTNKAWNKSNYELNTVIIMKTYFFDKLTIKISFMLRF